MPVQRNPADGTSIITKPEDHTAHGTTPTVSAVTVPASHSTQYAYDTENNLVSITDANGHVTSFGYDAFGRVTQTAFPSGLAESYAYDAVGNLISKTDRNGNTIQYLYDALDRLSHKGYPDSTGVDYVYDLVGKIKQVSDPTGSYGFAYDNMGRLIGTTTSYSFLPNQTFTNTYTYDAASNRTSLTAPDGSITTYGYDTLNRLNGLANSWAGSFGFGYDALSRRTSLTRPNGVNTSYSYDSLSRLLGVLHQAGSSTVDGASYTYDNAGNRTSKTNYLNGITENYTYDALYELTQVTQGPSITESYSYDAVGNRLSSLGVPLYNYNSSNELTSTTQGGYTYDANGNTLSDAAGKQYTWDFENRLSQVTVPQTGGVSALVTFKYDPFGRRIQKSGSNGTTNYVYDGGNLLGEMDAIGNSMSKYTDGPNLDEPIAELGSGSTSYYQLDGLGSATSLTGVSGTIQSTYTYDSFGNVSSSSGTVISPFRFTSREADPETGLYYYRSRYYDQTSGRFLSEDPSGLGKDVNLYDYVRNSPIGLTDPFGLVDMSYTIKNQPINLGDYLIGLLFPNGFTGYTHQHTDISGDCAKLPCGKYKLRIRIHITFEVGYYLESTHKHELGHVGIAEDFYNKQRSRYEQLESVFDSKTECDYALHQRVLGFPNTGRPPTLQQMINTDALGQLQQLQNQYDSRSGHSGE